MLAGWRLIAFGGTSALNAVTNRATPAPSSAPLDAFATQSGFQVITRQASQSTQDDPAYTQVTFDLPGSCAALYPPAQALGWKSGKDLTADTCSTTSYAADTFTTPDGVTVRADWPDWRPGELDLSIGR